MATAAEGGECEDYAWELVARFAASDTMVGFRYPPIENPSFSMRAFHGPGQDSIWVNPNWMENSAPVGYKRGSVAHEGAHFARGLHDDTDASELLRIESACGGRSDI
jgi:hypothetical protein